MGNSKNINNAKYKWIGIIFTVLLFCVYNTPFAEAQTTTSYANISVSVTKGMSAMIVDNSINTLNSANYNSSMGLLINSIPGRIIVVSYGAISSQYISSLKDKINTGFTSQGSEQSLCSAGKRSETESNILYDNNETGKLQLNITEITESLKNESQENSSKDLVININY